MALKNHNGSFTYSQILANNDYSDSRMTAVKVLKSVFVEEAAQYQFIYQAGRIEDNKFTPSYGGKTLGISSSAGLAEMYPKIWTPDTLSPKKGDILVGTDSAGNRVLVVYQDDSRCHRLTKRVGADRDQSSAGLEYYKRLLPDLKVLKNTYNNKPFSEI